MSRNPETPLARNLLLFNEAAAARGDGLHPLLAAALAKTGPISGPPANPSETPENVIQVTFSDTAEGGQKTGWKST